MFKSEWRFVLVSLAEGTLRNKGLPCETLIRNKGLACESEHGWEECGSVTPISSHSRGVFVRAHGIILSSYQPFL